MDLLPPNAGEPAQDKIAKGKGPKPSRPSRLFVEYYGSLVLVLIALLIGAGFVVIKPKIDTYKQTLAQTQVLGQEAENDRQYYAGLSRSVAAAQTIAPDVLTKVDRALPRAPEIPEMIVALGDLADRSGVQVVSMSFQASDLKAASGVQTLNLTLNVNAPSYQSFKTFLSSLEHSLRLIDVQSFAFTPTAKGNLTASLQARAYYFVAAAPPVAPAPAAAAAAKLPVP